MINLITNILFIIKKDIRPFVVLIFFLFVFLSLNNFINKNFNSKTGAISPLSETKKGYEVFGFAPYWNINRLNNINFSALTTLGYFDVPVLADGSLATYSPGYQTFQSKKATDLFEKAHKNGTRVVLTLTQMNNYDISALLTDPVAQEKAIDQSVKLVKNRGIDGVNIDFEYVGNPGKTLRNYFSQFVRNLTVRMHNEVKDSKVTVSVYASSAKDPKIYDLSEISKSSDGIFMMAYDFATASADNAMPTSPLYGHKEGKYWYDIATAVDDFLKVMPSEKLILGLPWYAYNYPVSQPVLNADVYKGYYTYYWYGGRKYWNFIGQNTYTQTYAAVAKNIKPEKTGWDKFGQVGWKAYMDNGVWRMLFLEDPKSLKIKYDFAKDKNLSGVGIWALGNDEDKNELWDLITSEFGEKLVDNRIVEKQITKADFL